MLAGLNIRDFVLIDRLNLPLSPGLGVLTGETGAGKSILLDALGMATGARADSGFVAQGGARCAVTCEFDVPPDHHVWAYLSEHDIDADGGQLLLRRTMSADGRSRAHINDQPVSVSLLSGIGDRLVEIHGQMDGTGLLDPTGHRRLLDAFGGLEDNRAAVAEAFGAVEAARAALAEAEAALAAARADEDYLRHAFEEIEALAPEEGEEERLADLRARMMRGERLKEDLEAVHALLADDQGADVTARSALRRLERLAERDGEVLAPIIEALGRAVVELGETVDASERALRELDHDPQALEAAEERLFALRALARKHRTTVDALPALMADLAEKLRHLDKGETDISALRERASAAEARFDAAVEKLSKGRQAGARRLDKQVKAELAPLKLGKARFQTQIEPLEREKWTANGGDRVAFQVATNPGAPFGPLKKIASGGELARFILALKVVLAEAGSAPTLIFDEVDQGVGGAVADAVGERLARLAERAQVLVVTHSPQVAARADHHWRIEKDESRSNGRIRAVTRVHELSAAERREEIARMLSGASVTDSARAAADSLMARG